MVINMQNKVIPISEESAKKLNHYDTSILHWSTECSDATVRAHEAASNFASLKQARKILLLELVKECGINPDNLVQVMVSDGTIKVMIRDPEPEST